MDFKQKTIDCIVIAGLLSIFFFSVNLISVDMAASILIWMFVLFFIIELIR